MQDIITKIHVKQETNVPISTLGWKDYEIGAKGTNIILRNGDRTKSNVQDILFRDLEPKIYDYGCSIWNAHDQRYEQLTWENIKTWLNNKTIHYFLKEGDCIHLFQNEYLPYMVDDFYFYIIGMNTHNGQTEQELSQDLYHIDFCGSSLKDIYRAKELGNQTFLQTSNNGGNDINPNFFLQGLHDNDEIMMNNMQRCGLQDNESPYEWLISPKRLYLGRRVPKTPVLDMALRAMLRSFTSIEDFFSLLLDQGFGVDETRPNDRYPFGDQNVKNAFFNNIIENVFPRIDFSLSSEVAFVWQRHDMGLEQDNFLTHMRIEYGAPTPEHQCPFILWILNGEVPPTSFGNLQGNNAKNTWMSFLKILENLYYYLLQKEDFYKRSTNITDPQKLIAYTTAQLAYAGSDTETIYASRYIWSLTEEELFGQRIFGTPIYSQGQALCYPWLQSSKNRRKIANGLTGSTWATITPVDKNSFCASGLNTTTLVPTAVDVVHATVLGSNPIQENEIDMPICFRIQADLT